MVVVVNIVIISSERAYSKRVSSPHDSILTSGAPPKSIYTLSVCASKRRTYTAGHPEYNRMPTLGNIAACRAVASIKTRDMQSSYRTGFCF
jgi:hypothetical protein